MGIQHTIDITREQAIDRIKCISNLVLEKDFLKIEQTRNYEDDSLTDFVADNINTVEEITLNCDKYTNQMLEEIIDKPFYRFSMFENYFVIDN